MDNAATAVNSLLKKAGVKDSTADKTVPPGNNANDAPAADASLHVMSQNDFQEHGANTNHRKKAGVKDTTVDESVAPAVTKEHITKTHEERLQDVVEKERHQDHYHTTIQPLTDREVVPEKHDRKVAPTQEKNFNRDDGSVEQKVNTRENQITSSTTEGATRETKTREDAVAGEHVHHHLHETVQPVIEKETVVPSVTHTTIPIKERYQEKAVDHGTTRNTPMSVDEFKAAGNSIEGRQDIHKEYAGAPKVNESKD